MTQDNSSSGSPSHGDASSAPNNADDARLDADLTDEELSAVSGGGNIFTNVSFSLKTPSIKPTGGR